MIELTDKSLKRFIDKLTKLINSISKYNVETIWLMQLVYDREKKDIYPIIFCKDNKLDIFHFLKTKIDDEEFRSNVNFLSRAKNKVQKDPTLFSPTIIGTFKPEHLYMTNDVSDTFFIVGETFKDFTKAKKINRIDEDMNFYDENENLMSTKHFIYKNDISSESLIKSIDRISPKRIINDNVSTFKYLGNPQYSVFNELLTIINKDNIYKIEGHEIKVIKEILDLENTAIVRGRQIGDISISAKAELFIDFYRINPLYMYFVYHYLH